MTPSFLHGALTLGAVPGLPISLMASQWGAMPGEVFVLGLMLGGLASALRTQKPQVPEPIALPYLAPVERPAVKPLSPYHTQSCVFGSRAGVEL